MAYELLLCDMNHIKKTEVLELFHFGPIFAKYNLSDNFIRELNERGNSTNIDYTTKLAGHIKKENEFNRKDQEWFLSETKHVFLNYLQILKKNSLSNKNVTSLELKSLWINFMKKGEFNPIHSHSGDISFVIYISVPHEIVNECKNYTGTGVGPGTISFLFGEESNSYTSHHSFLPREGMMFMFPASLRHFVPPFKSNVTRISVSGNIDFIYN